MNKTIAIFARKTDSESLSGYKQVLDILMGYEVNIVLEERLSVEYSKFSNSIIYNSFSTADELKSMSPDLILSLGGDGTLLDSALYAIPCKIPVAGINFGRLGFLSVTDYYTFDLQEIINKIVNKNYVIENRGVLSISSNLPIPLQGLAVNDFTIQKSANSSMISIDVTIDNEPLNTYWADGLIISTPTGSTAYSLSCGGPIVAPDCNVMLINAVSPHQLNIRPYIVSSNVLISCKAYARNNKFLISCDSRYAEIEDEIVFKISMNSIDFQIIKFIDSTFINTLKKKLHWGDDERNH